MKDTVAHDRIVEHLESGGMGDVYKAEDLVLDQTVVLKSIPTRFLEDPAIKQRFLEEAPVAALEQMMERSTKQQAKSQQRK